MDLAGFHQRQPALDALGVTPIKADVFGEGAVDGLVVGIAQYPRGGIDEARIVFIRQHPDPAVVASPARRWHAALGLMRDIAQRHHTDRLHANAHGIGQHQVLRWCNEQLAGRNRLVHRT
ncbi:MAG: hypothetical protein ACD_54C00190G0001 [uncultured bacterium]|nr:MAG: hypothetical protein ACD_54C00190G0001 [uncultured bacterium]